MATATKEGVDNSEAQSLSPASAIEEAATLSEAQNLSLVTVRKESDLESEAQSPSRAPVTKALMEIAPVPPAPAEGSAAVVGTRRGVGPNAKRSKAQDRKKKRRRHVPRAVRREVFVRDGEQCTFVDAQGNRCPARGFLELDHVKAEALGGAETVANLRVRCRAHNLAYAAEVFGRAYVEERIHLRRRRSAPASAPSAPSFDAVARGLRSLGFREPEIRAAMAQLQVTLDPATPVETMMREALRILT